MLCFEFNFTIFFSSQHTCPELMAKIEAEKAKLEAEKAKMEAEKAKIEAEEAKIEAEKQALLNM